MSKLEQDPRLPMTGGSNYQQALNVRLYELFRTIAQVVNALESGGGGGIIILGTYATFAALVAAHPTGTAGDYYTVDSDLYGWDGGAWAMLAELRGPQGVPGNDGTEIELQKSATHIQWRYVGAGTWVDLVPLADLVGPAGTANASSVALAAVTDLAAANVQDGIAEVMLRIIAIETALNTARTYDNLGSSYGL